MANELTPQQELFCQNYIKNKCNASEAYRQSYNCAESNNNTIWHESCLLLQHPNVAPRIQFLQAEAAERNKVSVDSLTAEYDEIKILAMAEKDYSPAVSAVNGKAKIHGFDKVILGGDLNIKTVRIRDLSGKKPE